MAFSLSAEDFADKKYIFSSFRVKKINGKNLIVSEHGKWVILDDNELEKVENYKIKANEKLFKLLEEKGIILTESNFHIIQDFYHNKLNFMFHGVSLHIIVLTNRCNHKCVYCHASAKGANRKELDMTKNTAKKTVDFIFQSPSHHLSIEFQGGEPLLNFDVLNFIVNYAKKKNKTAGRDLRFSVVTNLEAMDDEKLDFLSKEHINICTSLDGPEEIHNFNRKSENRKLNSYKNASQWIAKIKKTYLDAWGDPRVSALVTITKPAIKNYGQVIDDYVKKDIRLIHLRPLNGLGFSKSSWGDIGYSPEEFIDFWKKSMEYIIKLNGQGKDIKERTAIIMLIKILTETDPNYLELRSPCGACTGQLAYNYNGDIYSCDEGRTLAEEIFKVGNVKQKYGNVTGCDKACAIINSSIIDSYSCNDCIWKPYCGTCPVINFSSTNSLIKPPINEDFRCRILYSQFEYLFERLMDEDFKKVVNT